MKKLDRKAFTLIELLAVITIMGILMLAGIPAISRIIENSRRDTFLDTAKQYVSSVKTMWDADSLECKESTGSGLSGDAYPSSGVKTGTYYILIDSSKDVGADTNYPTLLDKGGKSSWGQKDVKGYVVVYITDAAGVATGRTVKYGIVLTDGTHGITNGATVSSTILNQVGTSGQAKDYMKLKRADVLTKNAASPSMPSATSVPVCTEA